MKTELLPMNRLLYSFSGQLKKQYVSYLRWWRSLKANVKHLIFSATTTIFDLASLEEMLSNLASDLSFCFFCFVFSLNPAVLSVC